MSQGKTNGHQQEAIGSDIDTSLDVHELRDPHSGRSVSAQRMGLTSFLWCTSDKVIRTFLSFLPPSMTSWKTHVMQVMYRLFRPLGL